jgi:hypothetical protein
MYRRESFDLLTSPNESSKKIRANSPATRMEDMQKREEEKKPALLNSYGLASKKNQRGGGELSGSALMAKAASTHGKHKGSDSGMGKGSELPEAGNNNQIIVNLMLDTTENNKNSAVDLDNEQFNELTTGIHKHNISMGTDVLSFNVPKGPTKISKSTVNDGEGLTTDGAITDNSMGTGKQNNENDKGVAGEEYSLCGRGSVPVCVSPGMDGMGTVLHDNEDDEGVVGIMTPLWVSEMRELNGNMSYQDRRWDQTRFLIPKYMA